MDINKFIDYNKIIIIDDNSEEGSRMKSALESKYISSCFFHIDGSNIEIPKFNNIRLVFLDLNYPQSNPMSGSSMNASIALSYLSKFITSNSFYILVIWSSHTTESIKDAFLTQLNRQNEIAKPYIHIELDKNEYTNIEAIIQGINDKLSISDISLSQIFFDWENKVCQGITDTMSNILSNKANNDISKLLNSMAEAYSGGNHPNLNTIKNSLLTFNSVLEDSISKLVLSSNYDVYHQLTDGSLDIDEKSKINSFLMFSRDVSRGPGSIFKTASSIIDKNRLVNFPSDPSIIDIAIDISTLCDVANNKQLFYYFIYGVLVKKKNGTGRDIKAKDFDHCYKISSKNFYYNGDIYQIIIDLKSKQSLKRSKPKSSLGLDLKLRDNIVIEIQHKVSEHLSRPGHILL